MQRNTVQPVSDNPAIVAVPVITTDPRPTADPVVGLAAVVAHQTNQPGPADVQERSRPTASEIERGMLLAHRIDGENVGVKVLHVEPDDDNGRVLLVLAGPRPQWYQADELLDVVDPKDAQDAQRRLDRKRLRIKQAENLRRFADAMDANPDVQWPVHLSLSGYPSTADDLAAIATILGVESSETPRDNGDVYRHIEYTFGEEHRYDAGVEVTLTHTERHYHQPPTGSGR